MRLPGEYGTHELETEQTLYAIAGRRDEIRASVRCLVLYNSTNAEMPILQATPFTHGSITGAGSLYRQNGLKPYEVF